MDFNAIIGVVIGMILIFSLLSIIVTQINSLISVILKTRASHLRDGIVTLIRDETIQAQVLRHPLMGIVTDKRQTMAMRIIGALTGSRKTEEMITEMQAQTATQAAQRGETLGTLQSPSLAGVTWVDPKIFVDSLFDTLLNNARDQFYKSLSAAIKPLPEGNEKKQIQERINAYKIGGITAQALEVDAASLTSIEARNALKAAIAEVEPKRISFEKAITERNMQNVLMWVSNVSDANTRRALQTLISSAQTVEAAQQKIEKWFDARMNQTTDAYKRHISLYTLIIGFTLAALLNADAIHLASALYTAPVVREGVQQVATSFTAQQISAGTSQAAIQGSENVDVIAAQTANIINQVANLNLPIGWIYNDAQCNIAPPAVPPAGVIISTITPSATATATAIQETPTLPLEGDGFTTQEDSSAQEETIPPVTGEESATDENSLSNILIQTSPCNDRRNLALLSPWSSSFKFEVLFVKILGLALTMFAIGQGAPFWFDLLNRIVRGGSSSAPTAQPINVVNNIPVTSNNPPIPPDGGGAAG